jgi:acetyl-CoA C-acetyltransferase
MKIKICFKMILLDKLLNIMNKRVVIVSAVRTPIGSFMGGLSTVPAPRLGQYIKGALDRINLDPNLVDEVYMGNVVQAGTGQAPARQAAFCRFTQHRCLYNKIKYVHQKSVMLAAQAIQCGDAEIVAGMENMTCII